MQISRVLIAALVGLAALPGRATQASDISAEEMAKISCEFSSDQKKIFAVKDLALKTLSQLDIKGCEEKERLQRYVKRCSSYSMIDISELKGQLKDCQRGGETRKGVCE